MAERHLNPAALPCIFQMLGAGTERVATLRVKAAAGRQPVALHHAQARRGACAMLHAVSGVLRRARATPEGQTNQQDPAGIRDI